MEKIDNIPVWGYPDEASITQMKNALKHPRAVGGALMGDHHLGYSVPIGGVIAYDGAISPSAVGFDIACGNKAVKTDIKLSDIDSISKIMDEIFNSISFGVGLKNKENIDHELFYRDVWNEQFVLKDLKEFSRSQLGTVGSGNHYVDVFVDSNDFIWIGVHFGSRGLGHKIATYFIKEGGGKDGINTDPVVFDVDSNIGLDYIQCMNLAGEYAYAGRDWVCKKVSNILGANIIEEIHNHHNYAWKENNLWVVRKGATPAFIGQKGFVGASMGENSVILQGCNKNDEEYKSSFASTVHGAGRVLSRTAAAGKFRWRKGKKVKISDGSVSVEMMNDWIQKNNVVLRGGGTDESPHCYKRLTEVLEEHKNTIDVIETLKPIGVCMAGSNEYDPYKD
jgi:tRNA-splicing ligase RtcB